MGHARSIASVWAIGERKILRRDIHALHKRPITALDIFKLYIRGRRLQLGSEYKDKQRNNTNLVSNVEDVS